MRRGNDRVGSARPPPLASVHSPHPPLRVVSPWDCLSQIREGEEEEVDAGRVRMRQEMRRDRGRLVLEGEGVNWAGRMNPAVRTHEA